MKTKETTRNHGAERKSLGPAKTKASAGDRGADKQEVGISKAI